MLIRKDQENNCFCLLFFLDDVSKVNDNLEGQAGRNEPRIENKAESNETINNEKAKGDQSNNRVSNESSAIESKLKRTQTLQRDSELENLKKHDKHEKSDYSIGNSNTGLPRSFENEDPRHDGERFGSASDTQQIKNTQSDPMVIF